MTESELGTNGASQESPEALKQETAEAMSDDDDGMFDDDLNDALMSVDEASLRTPSVAQSQGHLLSQPMVDKSEAATPMRPLQNFRGSLSATQKSTVEMSQAPSTFNMADFDLGEIDKNNMPELMRQYYGRFFPYGRFIEWLSYGDRDKLTQREFSFTIRVPFQKDEEVYLRYLSYSSKNEFKNDLIKKNPEKIDIGAVFSARPKTKNALRPGAFKPVERELVFDIDMTDYDAVRTCCSGADICNLCWKYMTVAVKILHRALTEDFGFKNLLWVYSGRRGVHCWVCDEKARKLSEEARKAVVNYLEVIKGGEKKEKKVYFPPGSLHPSIKKSLKVLEKYFSEIFLEDQDILSYPDKEKMFLNIMQDEKMRNELETEFDGLNDSKDKWHTFVKYLANNPDKKTQQLRNEIVFQYLYPRLDAQVSMHLNHLLKSPFCVHPKTGKVCVPFRAENADQFDPLNVPTVYGLCQEINDYNSKHAGDDQAKKIPDWQKTSLVKYMKIMDEFLVGLKPEIEANLKKRTNVKEKQASDEWMRTPLKQVPV